MDTRSIIGLLACTLGLFLSHAVSAEQPLTALDIAFNQARVIDPESGLDAVRSVGVKGGKIAIISKQTLAAAKTIDARGLVLSPGFIDLHTHAPTEQGQLLQMQDGVTTALELEVGAYPLAEFVPELKGRARINYGASVSYGSARIETKLGMRMAHISTDNPRPNSLLGYWKAFQSLFTTPLDATHEAANKNEREQILAMLKQGLDDGAIGIGLPLDYFSEGADEAELKAVFALAASYRAPLFIHIRRGINGDPRGLNEVIDLARQTKAAIHICHIQHNAMKNTELFLNTIAEARTQGVDVSTEVMPYNAGSTGINAAVFNRNWQEIFAIDYQDVQWAPTGERFTEETWTRYRQEHPHSQVIHHYVDEAWTRRAIAEPGVIIVSDLLPQRKPGQKVAPHIGSFSKILGRYVREEELIDLPTAIAAMTLLPARRLQSYASAFADKGRIKVGADADITVFDPQRIRDQATYMEPFTPSLGVRYQLINGQLTIDKGRVVDGVFAGRQIQVK